MSTSKQRQETFLTSVTETDSHGLDDRPANIMPIYRIDNIDISHKVQTQAFVLL